MSKELTICNRIYSWLYNSKEELPDTFFLSLDKSLSRDEDYNAFKLKLINERMDYFTSDREIVSLIWCRMTHGTCFIVHMDGLTH